MARPAALPTSGHQERATMGISDELREHILAWLKANNIDPNNIPVEPYMTYADDQVTTHVFLRDDKGKRLMEPAGDALATTVATFPVTVAPPPDVAEWLRPRCPECGR